MRLDKIPYPDTGYFSGLIADYLGRRPELRSFYGPFPSLEELGPQVREKLQHYPQGHRDVLCKVLEAQYDGISVSEMTQAHLEALKASNSVTVVTGHQLNLFTGPLYFHYKIISTIDLCRRLKEAYPETEFVPVYWMATEDHDFEEINHFNVNGKEFRWNRESGGAVGRMETTGLQAVAEALAGELGQGQSAERLLELFRTAYLEHPTLAAATRFLANALFGDHGLVVLDADDPDLKAQFAPYMERDLVHHEAFSAVTESAKALKEVDPGYPVQVNPREINLFYLYKEGRSRIVRDEHGYAVLDTELRFSESEMIRELKAHPQRFSPNVITRPLYQEVILPNICYIGGGGELAYWFELKGYFQKSGVPFPALLLRNSALFVSEKQFGKAQRLGLEVRELFLPQNTLINKKIRQISNIDIDLSPQREHLREQFTSLHVLAQETDPSFAGAVKAQEVKQLKGLDHLEKRLLKAQKRKLKDQVNRMVTLQNALFPEQGLQERNRNFSECFLELGDAWVPTLLEGLNALDLRFTIFTYAS